MNKYEKSKVSKAQPINVYFIKLDECGQKYTCYDIILYHPLKCRKIEREKVGRKKDKREKDKGRRKK